MVKLTMVDFNTFSWICLGIFAGLAAIMFIFTIFSEIQLRRYSDYTLEKYTPLYFKIFLWIWFILFIGFIIVSGVLLVVYY